VLAAPPTAVLAPGTVGDSAPPDEHSVPIEKLLEQFNSPDFRVRESATDAVINRGASTLPLLAERFFEGAPETNYRIRIALEGIASTGDEATFLRSAAMLLTLYSNGNGQIFEQIEQARVKWQTVRTQNILNALRGTGAVVIQKKSNDIRGRGAVLVRSPRSAAVAEQQKVTVVKRTTQQQREIIDLILESEMAVIRKFVFELMPKSETANNSLNLNLAVGLADPVLNRLTGTTVSFPSDWADRNEGSEDLKNLGQIDDRLFVEIDDVGFSQSQFDAIASASNVASLKLTFSDVDAALPSRFPESLQAIHLERVKLERGHVDSLRQCKNLRQILLVNCQFDAAIADQINDLTPVRSVICRFENDRLSGAQVQSMAQLDKLRVLYLKSTEFGTGALKNLRQLSQLRSLHVTDVPATAPFFANVSEIPQLKDIQFKGCKLDIPAYKRLARGRRIRMNFQAQAFLGIQGNAAVQVRREEMDTMVSAVVPGSAAAESGILAGDFIEKIGGRKVQSFDDVRLHITQFSAGDKVEIEVLRNGKPISLTVTLGDFETAKKF
jgi:hypothetical protein